MEIAVCIPAFNEGVNIGTVVRDYKMILPGATVYVYDNNSTDNTVEAALSAGAVVRNESRQGKGYVVKRMMADIEADIYILVDGDNTYDSNSAPKLAQAIIENNIDMVVGTRLSNQGEFRKGHYTGNIIFSKIISILFSANVKDVLSGYRALSRRFVKSFPSSSKGFEIESEMTIHCLELSLPYLEIQTEYKNRAPNSCSKLNTIPDGLKIIFKIIMLLKSNRPYVFFGFWALIASICGAVLFFPVLDEYLDTGLVPRFPTLITAVTFFLFGLICMTCGIILDSIASVRLETKKLHYLKLVAPLAENRVDEVIIGDNISPQER